MAPPAAVLRAMNTLRHTALPDLGRTEQSVLIELLSYVSLRNPREPVHPRAAVLAEKLHLACVTVRRALVRLHRSGLIERFHQEHSERTGNFRTVRTRISDSVLQIAGLLQPGEPVSAPAEPIPPHSTLPKNAPQAVTQALSATESAGQNLRSDTTEQAIHGDGLDTRPCISEIHAIENTTIKNKTSKSTVASARTHFARKDTLPADLQPWVDRGIAPAVLATGMKRAREAGTTLSAVLLAIGERLRQATHPQAYLMGTLRRMTTGDEPVWERQRPITTLSPQEAALREKAEAQAAANLEGHWFTDGQRFYRPVGSLCEVYDGPPVDGERMRPERAPVPTSRLQKWLAAGRVTTYAVPSQDHDVSLLRKALTGCMV
ncbi:hypothetical protein HFV02_13070 [Acidithiobacillus caldus]|uniref:hypothetical protein n=1 Tax=Acidithiobacillus caldus TaxID=33059 RepID=UPI001C073733|nr:hypothetical protein [Acidithiobacillus caldus]MBU2803164.1 hypothetical protein [Acidithiobacillus caldus]